MITPYERDLLLSPDFEITVRGIPWASAIDKDWFGFMESDGFNLKVIAPNWWTSEPVTVFQEDCYWFGER